MLSFGAPAILLAGLLAALIPLGLHLLRPLPGERHAFPTARFLTREPRNRLRVAAPDHLPLLALRMALLVVIGAALADPGWHPRRRGAGQIVLLERSIAGDTAAWARALAGAGRSVRPGDAVIAFDSTLSSAIASLSSAARTMASRDSLRVTLVSTFPASAWTEASAALRAAAWAGRIGLVQVAPGDRGSAPAGSTRNAAIQGESPGFLRIALEAAGVPVVPAESADVVFQVAGGSPRPGSVSTRGAEGPARKGSIRFDEGSPITGLRAATPEAGVPLAVWEDGTPAATVIRSARGCRVSTGFPLEAGELPLSPRYPHLAKALAEGCAPPRPIPGSLDTGARQLLAGLGSDWVPARTLSVAAPIPLDRWLLLLAALIALAESLVARRRERRG